MLQAQQQEYKFLGTSTNASTCRNLAPDIDLLEVFNQLLGISKVCQNGWHST
jgi:hypothetical protein